MVTCPHCGTLLQPKPVPGAVHFPRRLECPLHGYIVERISPRKDEAIYPALSSDAIVRNVTDANVPNRPKAKATVMVRSTKGSHQRAFSRIPMDAGRFRYCTKSDKPSSIQGREVLAMARYET